MFHSIVRGSSPAWYSRTSLYSRPLPRNDERSSQPGWKPRRRSTGQRQRGSRSSIAMPPATASGGNPIPEVDPWRRESFKHAPDDGFRSHAGGDALVGEHQPVPDNFGRHLTDVMGQHIRPAPHEGQ